MSNLDFSKQQTNAVKSQNYPSNNSAQPKNSLHLGMYAHSSVWTRLPRDTIMLESVLTGILMMAHGNVPSPNPQLHSKIF